MINSLLNALLKREPWAREKLARHAGKTVRFAWGAQSLSLTIASDGSVQRADAAAAPDVTLTLQWEKLQPARLLSGNLPDMAAFTHIAGDAALAQAVGDLARGLRWEPEDDLARLIGDVPAMCLVRGARTLLGGARTAGARLAHNVAEFLSEEQPVIAGKPVLRQQQLDAAQLQTALDAVERQSAALRARLDRLGG